MMTLSERGEAFVKRFEGLDLHPYRDIAGVWTVGYGHTAGFNDGRLDPNRVITPGMADELFDEDMRGVARHVDRLFAGFLIPSEFDALCSFVFNVGPGAFNPRQSPNTYRRAIMVRDAVGNIPRAVSHKRSAALRPLADALLWWDKARVNGVSRPVRGLTRRRIEEAELLLYADYELSDDGIVNEPGIKERDQ